MLKNVENDRLDANVIEVTHHVEVDRCRFPFLQVGVDGGVVTVAVTRRTLERLDPDLLLKTLNALSVKK